MKGDVSSVSDCQRIVKETVDFFGSISALVTAAGYYEEELLADVSESAFDENVWNKCKRNCILVPSGIALFTSSKGQYCYRI